MFVLVELTNGYVKNSLTVSPVETENVNIFNLHYKRKMMIEELSRFRRKNINFCQKFKPKTLIVNLENVVQTAKKK